MSLDPLNFGPPNPDPVLLSLDPDPTCNNGSIKVGSGFFSAEPDPRIKIWILIPG